MPGVRSLENCRSSLYKWRVNIGDDFRCQRYKNDLVYSRRRNTGVVTEGNGTLYPVAAK